MSKYNSGTAKEGDNARAALFLATLASMPKIDLYADNAARKLKRHCDKFMETCAEFDFRPGMANFAVSLHMSRVALRNRIEGIGQPLKSDVHDVLMDMFNILTAVNEDGMLTGASNVVGSIFIAKNNFGYKDQNEQIVVHKNTTLTAEELKALADNLPEVIDADYKEVVPELTDENKQEE